MRIPVLLALAALLGCGGSTAPSGAPEASSAPASGVEAEVEAAVRKHLSQRTDLDMTAMDMTIENVDVQGDAAVATGEEGLRPPEALSVSQRPGQEHGLVPAGLGARDTLRLEAGYPLYGQELTEDTTPYEGGIGWVVKAKKAQDFVGKAALAAQKEAGVPRRLLGLRGSGRIIARPGAEVAHDGESVGVVTSGTFSPTLQIPIALARVDARALEGPLTVEVRGAHHPVEIVKPPFVESRVRG